MEKSKKTAVKIIGVSLGIFIFLLLLSQPSRNSKNSHKLSTIKIASPDVLETLKIEGTEARSIFIYDLASNKKLFAKNERERLPLASLTKMMVASVVYDFDIPKYSTVKITSEAIRQTGDNNLKEGDEWTLKDLLDFALVESSNDATRAVASIGFLAEKEKSSLQIFVEHMNKKARELGLEETYFLNDTGLDITNETSGGYGSAKDMVTLISHLYKNHPESIEATSYANIEISSSQINYDAHNTNRALRQSSRILASKTGYTDLAGGNLAVVFDVGFNHPVAVAILGSSEEGRFKDIEIIIKSVYDYFNTDNYD